MTEFFNEIGSFFNDIFTNLLNFLWDFLFMLIDILFGWINLPPFPQDVINNINSFLDLIFNNLRLLGFFIRPTTLKIAIPLLLIIINFDLIYKVAMWVIRKIPFLNMS